MVNKELNNSKENEEKIQLKLGADRYMADNLNFDGFKEFKDYSYKLKIESAVYGLVKIFKYLDTINVEWLHGSYFRMTFFPVIVKLLDAMNIKLEAKNHILTKTSENLLFDIRKDAYLMYKNNIRELRKKFFH